MKTDRDFGDFWSHHLFKGSHDVIFAMAALPSSNRSFRTSCRLMYSSIWHIQIYFALTTGWLICICKSRSFSIVYFLTSFCFVHPPPSFPQLVNGAAVFAVDVESLLQGPSDPLSSFLPFPPVLFPPIHFYDGQRVQIHAEVTDNLTRITQEGESEITYYGCPLTVTEHPDNPPFFKPGLPFDMQVSTLEQCGEGGYSHMG